ncbi:hypothetical protein ACVW1C_001875 [Bradyrhizobium sp. USDA 4011]
MNKQTEEKQISAEQKAWLAEHLPYELKMARYCLKQMQRRGTFYLDWNAYHSAFAVAACNLAAFLTNSEKLKASDFARDFRSRKDDLAGKFARLEPQVFHLGKMRPDGEGKFVLADAERVLAWIEEEMAKFVSQLGSWQQHWNEQRSQPEARPDGP